MVKRTKIMDYSSSYPEEEEHYQIKDSGLHILSLRKTRSKTNTKLKPVSAHPVPATPHKVKEHTAT